MPESSQQIPLKEWSKILKKGRGFKVNDMFGNNRGGVFEFASSNPLWKAALDIIDFMPFHL